METQIGEESLSLKTNKSAKRAKHSLPAKKISSTKQFEMLRAFAIASTTARNPVSITQVADIQHIHAGSVSICNPYYVESGFIVKQGHKFVPSDEVFAYNQAAEWDEESAGKKLAPIIKKTWFAKALLPRLQLNSMNEKAAIQALAEVCEASPSEQRQLSMLLDYLEFSGLILRDNGFLKLSNNQDNFEKKPDKENTEHKAPPLDEKKNREENDAKYFSYSIPIPNRLPVVFEIPKNFTPEDWQFFEGVFKMYLDRLKKEDSEVNKQ